MAESRIAMTPQELRDAANTINGQCQSVLDMFDQMKVTVDNLDANWDGSSQTQYFETFNSIYTQCKDQIQQVGDALVAMLNGSAQAFEEADDQVASSMKL